MERKSCALIEDPAKFSIIQILRRDAEMNWQLVCQQLIQIDAPEAFNVNEELLVQMIEKL